MYTSYNAAVEGEKDYAWNCKHTAQVSVLKLNKPLGIVK